MQRRSPAGSEFLSTSESLFLNAACPWACFTFLGVAVLKLSMNRKPYRTWLQQRDHAQHAKGAGTLGQRSQELYCLALPCPT